MNNVTSPVPPIYTKENCTFSHPLTWTLSLFWREATIAADWLPNLTASLEPDGIRLISHRFQEARSSQFLISSKPHVSPRLIVQRVKGRLQHIIRQQNPKAFQRNFAIRSVGKVKREVVQQYVGAQVSHHPMADPKVQERFQKYQISRREIDLTARRQTSHGIFWHILHVVLVHQERWREIRHEKLQKTVNMIIKASQAKGYLLSEAGVLPDHVHLLLGCGFDNAPEEVISSFLNNLAFAHGMRPLFQFGAFVGTVGEYDLGALGTQSPLDPGKQDRGVQE